MCVISVAKWPPARVAIQPPSVEYSNDCGKCRSVSSCSRSWSSSPGPVAPAWILAAREARSISSTRSSAFRSIETARSSPRGSTPPTTLVPPPYGITATSSEHAQSSTRSSSCSSRGTHHGVGRVVELAAEAAHDVAIGLPERVRRA